MIIMLFGGGLGNQMFQYALGRHLSIINNQPLKLDNTRYPTGAIPDAYKNIRLFSLSNFNIVGEIISLKEKNDFLNQHGNNGFFNKLRRKISKKFNLNLFENNYYKKLIIIEPYNNNQKFDHNILDYNYKNAYFRGNWASEKYFKNIRNIILADFTVKTDPDKYNRALLEEIKNKTSVSLHFRRGDITDPKSIVGTLSLNYYHQAIDCLASKIKNPHFYIFSDDNEWTRKKIKIKSPAVYVRNGLDKDYEDMRLMSHCKHHIIANSTFSWWGAWLATNPDKIVIAPEKYAQKIDIPNPDYYPASWIKIK